MFFHQLSFLALLVVVCSSYSFYFLGLALIRYLRPVLLPTFNDSEMQNVPTIHLVVATLNEAKFIEKKLINSMELQYPAGRKQIWVVDGGSSDATTAIVRRIALRYPNEIKLLESKEADKIRQVNLALAEIPMGDLVVITDADAIVESKSALLYSTQCLSNPKNGIVGGWTVPNPDLAILAETAYWDKQNRIRYVECVTYTATGAVAPFLAFRRDLIGRLPLDCVADDIFLSYQALLKNQRILYTPEIRVVELRVSTNVRKMFLHKWRKAHAYTSELFRVLYTLPMMPMRLKFIYLFKLYQFFYLPWVVALMGLEALILTASGHFTLVLTAFGILFFAILAASLSLKPPPGQSRGGFRPTAIFATMQTFLLINIVLMWNAVSFPFWQQRASYEKICSHS